MYVELTSISVEIKVLGNIPLIPDGKLPLVTVRSDIKVKGVAVGCGESGLTN